MFLRLLPLLFVLPFIGPLHAQSGGTVRPTPRWAAGDTRRVGTTTTTHITIDTLTMDVTARGSYQLSVTSARKDGYVLAMRMEENSELLSDFNLQGLPHEAADSAMTLVRDLMERLYAPLKELDVRFKVSPRGEALEVVDTEKDKAATLKLMRELFIPIVEMLAKSEGKAPIALPAERIDHVLDSMYSAFVEVQVNELNYLLRPYGYDYPTSGSTREPILIHDVQAPLRQDFAQLPGTCELGLDSDTPEELVCRTIITYDPDALYEAFMKQGGNRFPREGLLLTEESVDHIDRRTGWITASTTVITMRTAEMRMRTETRSTLKPVR